MVERLTHRFKAILRRVDILVTKTHADMNYFLRGQTELFFNNFVVVAPRRLWARM